MDHSAEDGYDLQGYFKNLEGIEMTKPRSQPPFRALQALAGSQSGYFTAKQAARLGYGYSHLSYHVGAQNIERIAHGLYRMSVFPLSDQDDLVRLAFWSRNRDDEVQAVVSHASALVLHGLSDLLPDTIHLSVPPRFQKRALVGCSLHSVRLDARDIEAREGFRVTTPLRTLLDAATAPRISSDELAGAVAGALERGLVRRRALEQRAREFEGAGRILELLGRAGEAGA